MRINDMNAMLEAVRKMALMKQDGQDDLSARTLELANVMGYDLVWAKPAMSSWKSSFPLWQNRKA